MNCTDPIPTTVSAWDSAPHVDRYPESSGLPELVSALRELTALVRILVDRQAVSAPAVRQDPRTYQTIDKPR